MSTPARKRGTALQRARIHALIDRHGVLFSTELGIDLSRNTPSPLFRWLCAALLYSARISANIATRAAGALAAAGWTTAARLADSSWAARVEVLHGAGYGRYDERTATMLGATATLLLNEYRGDLRRLRAHAAESPDTERALLKACPGIGDVGVDIFFREAQTAWPELRPFADARALAAARRLGLPDTAAALSRTAGADDLPRLVAALVRTALADDYAEIERAAERPRRR